MFIECLSSKLLHVSDKKQGCIAVTHFGHNAFLTVHLLVAIFWFLLNKTKILLSLKINAFYKEKPSLKDKLYPELLMSVVLE